MSIDFFDAHLKLPLKVPGGDLARFKSAMRVHGAELVWLDMEAIGAVGQPRCPICFHPALIQESQFGEVVYRCGRCGHSALVLTFSAHAAGPYFVSIPWTE